jgi:hypothetical protein
MQNWIELLLQLRSGERGGVNPLISVGSDFDLELPEI